MLIVDDEETILFTMGEYFAERGYHVDCARNPAEATESLSKAEYAIVIVDLRLQGYGDTGGLEVLASIFRQSPATRRIVLTAYGANDLQQQARQLGVDAYLLKPQPLGALAKLIDGLVVNVGENPRT